MYSLQPLMSCPLRMSVARVVRAAVWEQGPGEVRAGQEGAEGGAILLHHLDPEPDPLVLLYHDLVDACGQPGVRHGRVAGLVL